MLECVLNIKNLDLNFKMGVFIFQSSKSSGSSVSQSWPVFNQGLPFLSLRFLSIRVMKSHPEGDDDIKVFID